ncbi:hypothetical protein ZWY2020_040957 [Hordeum vulgare]|nr:hypothetical protein ZWY2020_040957 [Hordeum vulgare]
MEPSSLSPQPGLLPCCHTVTTEEPCRTMACRCPASPPKVPNVAPVALRTTDCDVTQAPSSPPRDARRSLLPNGAASATLRSSCDRVPPAISVLTPPWPCCCSPSAASHASPDPDHIGSFDAQVV